MTSPRVLVHTSRQSIRWSDMDTFGHVNNVMYFRYMEQARIEWVYAVAGAGGFGAGQGSVIVNASCNFRVPLVYPGAIEVRMWLGDPGRTSVGSYYEISKDGKAYADGAARIVWIDTTTGRPHPIPDALVAPLRAGA